MERENCNARPVVYPYMESEVPCSFAENFPVITWRVFVKSKQITHLIITWRNKLVCKIGKSANKL